MPTIQARYPKVSVAWSTTNAFSEANDTLWDGFIAAYLDFPAQIPRSYLRALYPDMSTAALVNKILDAVFLSSTNDPNLAALLAAAPVPNAAYAADIFATAGSEKPNLWDLILMDEFEPDRMAWKNLQHFIDFLYHIETQRQRRAWGREDFEALQDTRYIEFFKHLGSFLHTAGV